MSRQKETRPSFAEPGQAAGNGLATGDSLLDCTTVFPVGQAAISDFLSAEIRQPYKQEVKRAADHALGQMRLDGV